MKSTRMGKDDDTALTLKYNEGGEYRIGPDLLKAFKNLGAVKILEEKKKDSSDKNPKKKGGKKKDSPDETQGSEKDSPDETQGS